VGQPVKLAGPASAQRRALIAREYRTPGHPAVYFLLMPYDEQRFTHGPEVCYEGLGWRLHREVDLRLPAGHRLNRLVGEDDRGDRLLIAYGVTLGAALHPDGLALCAPWPPGSPASPTCGKSSRSPRESRSDKKPPARPL
jgi:hypothetical protein